MFDLAFFSDDNLSYQGISTGWTIKDHEIFPRLSDRISDPISPIDESGPGRGSWQTGNDSENDRGSDDIPNTTNEWQQAHVAEESEEDDWVNPYEVRTVKHLRYISI